MSFALTFSWRRFVLAMGDRDCANKNKSAVFAFGVPAKNFAHQVLPLELSLGLTMCSSEQFDAAGSELVNTADDTNFLVIVE
jgi:hypothetical protein